MSFSNPDIRWSELERVLSGKPRNGTSLTGATPAGLPGDGGDSPGWSRKRQPYRPPLTLGPLSPVDGSVVPYAELHCRTNFSFLEGASHPDELVQAAVGLGYRALAISDRNSLAGVVRAHVAAKAAALKLLVGAEITPLDAPPVVLLATDRAAYGRLCRLLTCGRRNAPKGECRLTLNDLADHALITISILPVRICQPKVKPT